jgi:predicted Ser/Thr protein kinase
VNPESPTNHPQSASGDPLGGLSPYELLREAADPPAPQGAAPSVEEIASAFPKLEILGLLGQGGMGFVYRARQPDLDRVVALKILRPELGRDPAFAERFAREARVLAKLNHPNIVNVFEHGQAGRFFYLLMEYVDGVNLRQAMRAGRFTPEQALAIVPGICDALQAAHAQGIWHRDIKPENILLDQEGRVKIVDFGIARIVGDPARDFTLTLTGAALGSAPYMAPEQHERPHEVDHRADIYSLGVVFYEMLTGELPLGRFPNPSERAAVHARIDAIVLQTLEKERELRQQSATEVKTDIQRAARDGGNAPAEPAPAPSRAESWFSKLPSLVRRSLLAWLGGLLLLGTGLALQENRISGAAFPLSVGAVAAVLGLLGGLWSLFEMRRGWLPQTARGLLTWTMLLPVQMAVGFGAAALAVEAATDLRLPYLLTIPVAFTGTLVGVWPLRHFLHSGFTRPRFWLATSCLLLAVALAAGKFCQGKWPFIDATMEQATLRNAGPMSDYDSRMRNVETNLREVLGEQHENVSIAHGKGSGVVELKYIVPYRNAGPTSDALESVAARLNQLTDPTTGPWRIGDRDCTNSRQTEVFKMVVAGIAGISVIAAFFLAGCSWRAGLSVVVGSALLGGLASVTPGWAPGQSEEKLLATLTPLPPFTPEQLPREIDFSTPEASARTILFAAHRGQMDILREAVTPELATKLDQKKGWERFAKPGEAVALGDMGTKLERAPDRAFRRRSGNGDAYTLLDGKWKMDTPAYETWGTPRPRALPPPIQPTVVTGKEPEKVTPKEDPVATVRLLNRLANEQNADAFLARKWKSSFPISFGGEVPATRYMAPFYGEILHTGELPGKDKDEAKLVVKFKRPDGKEDFREFELSLQDNEWRLLTDSAPEYRAWTPVEFKPPQGNAPAILKNHLGDQPFHPVPGTDLYLIGGEDRGADDARSNADFRAKRLLESLAEAGLDKHCRVVAPAEKPTEPWMGGEPEVPEIPPANP